MLQQVGFRRVGVHRNKDVVLYAQGEIRIVVNREPDSFAHSYQLLHGPSVCALAIETDDAMAAVGRAESYGVTRFHGRIGPNEHSIPAVRSLDGSLIYFTDATLASAFVARWCVGATAETTGGVFRVREDQPTPRIGTGLHRTP